MPEWEHKIVVTTGFHTPQPRDSKLQFSSLEAEQAGGWEFVSAVPRHDRDEEEIWLIFKRPKP
jgi:hypothetical protein